MSLFENLDEITPDAPLQTENYAEELGQSGTVNTRGFIIDTETNPRMRWPRCLDEYEAMVRSDSTTRWMLALMTMPIRAAQWELEPGGTEPADREAAAGIEQALFHSIDKGWDDFVRRALDLLKDGHSVFEIVAEFRDGITYEWEPVRKEGDDPSKSIESVEVTRSMFVIKKLGHRLPKTIHRWVADTEDKSKLAYIQQILYGSEMDPTQLNPSSGISNNPTIPGDKLLVFVLDQQGDDWRGRSLLRPVWRNWEYKTKLENLEALGGERSLGLPVAYPPMNATQAAMDAVVEALKSIRQGENAYLVMPAGGKQSEKNPGGWAIELLNIQGDGGAGIFNAAINRHEASMSRNVLAEFMRLGHEQVGARATAEVQQSPYFQSIEALAAYLCSVIQPLVEKLFEWNYGKGKCPTIKISGIQEEDSIAIGAAVAQLIGARAIQADPDLEKWLRAMFHAPEPIPGWREQQIELAQKMAQERGGPPNGNSNDNSQGGNNEDRRNNNLQAGDNPKALSESAEDNYVFSLPNGRKLRRKPNAQEVAAQVDFAQLDALWQRGLDSLTDAVRRLQREQIQQIKLHLAESSDLERVSEVTATPNTGDVLFYTFRTLAHEGLREARSEAQRQGVTVSPTLSISQLEPELRARADALSQLLTSQLVDTARRRAISLTGGSLSRIEVANEVTRYLGDLKGNSVEELLRGGVTAAQNSGRALVFQTVKPTRIYASELLDTSTCEFCRAHDGTAYEDMTAAARDYPTGGYKFCAGRERCRGIIIANYSPDGES